MKIQSSFVLFVLCFCFSFIYVAPQMRFIYPNLIDVVETWAIGTSVWENTYTEFFNPLRFWPTLKFERSLMNTVFAYWPPAYFMYFASMLALTVYGVISVVRTKKADWILPVYIVFVMFISPVTVDTYWRLGAAETVFTLLLVASVYTILTKRHVWTVMLLVAFMATKESAVFYIPVYLLVFLVKKRFREFIFLSVVYLGFMYKISSLVAYAFTHDTYTSMITRSIPDGIRMVMHMFSFHPYYSFTLWVAIILFAYRMLTRSRGGSPQRWEWGYVFFALCMAGILTLVSFQNMYQPYYAFPWMSTVVIWMAWELTHTERIVSYIIVTAMVIAAILLRIPTATFQTMELWHSDYAGDNALIAYIEKTHTVYRYSFVREYRPEYAPALDRLYEQYGWSYESPHTAVIMKREEMPGFPGSEKLCGRTLLGKSSCKWGVRL